MEVIYQSPICPPALKANILEDVHNRNLLAKEDDIKSTLDYYPALCSADLKKFKEVLKNQEYAGLFTKDVSKYKPTTSSLMRNTKAAKSNELPKGGQLEVK